MIKYSNYQEAIFAFIEGKPSYTPDGPIEWSKPLPETVDFEGKTNCVVEAVAGSGKTSTIVKCLDFLPPGSKSLFVCFNSHIARELAARVPKNTQASTLNSVGWSICRANVSGVQLDVPPKSPGKNEGILRTFLSTNVESERKIFYAVKNQINKMVGLMKAMMVFNGDEFDRQFIAIADKYDVEIPELEDKDFDFQATCKKVFLTAIDCVRWMDYDDQIFMPVFMNWTFPRYDWIFGDEAQDWSPVQIELVKRLGQHGRIAAVGDRHQSIYGFRGSDPEAIQNIISSLDAVVLPLSICYRCPDAVIAEARVLVPHIENPVNNPKGEGVVDTVTTEEFAKSVAPGDYVLCRTTAPLVKRCLQQIRLGKKAIVKGRDIGRGIDNLLTSLAKNPATPVATFLDTLAQYKAEQIAKLTKVGRDQEASNVEDRADTLEVLAMECRTVADIHKRIETIFSDDTTDGIIFLTGHRAKGLETDCIWFLRPDLCPHPKSRKDWQKIQEANLRYVIITRAMRELHYVLKEKDEK